MSQSQGRIGVTTYRRNLAQEAAGLERLSRRLDELEARLAALEEQTTSQRRAGSGAVRGK